MAERIESIKIRKKRAWKKLYDFRVRDEYNVGAA